MTINVTRRAALVGLSTCVAAPVRAQTANRPKDAADSVTLEQPAVFDIAANTGSLKETVQKGQQLVWRPKGGASDGAFRVTNISVAFLRSESGGQLKMTFSGNVSSLGYLTAEEAKLNVIVRAKGGASLHSWSFGIPSSAPTRTSRSLHSRTTSQPTSPPMSLPMSALSKSRNPPSRIFPG